MEAVEAAYRELPDGAGVYVNRDDLRVILEAAAPHITGPAWEEGYGSGYKHGYADCLKLYGHDTKEES